ncbi:ATP-dependent RecD-like DNA helicase [Bosea eneae]|uniref:ATP-dependent RecD-like DNA helicase n=1 Tax=Bosea eneae TaxID=151454 RepID=A0ABW0IYJ8_9HYPH
MAWSPQQEAAIKAVRAWLKEPSSQVFYLAGFAGTGKTTLAKDLAGGVSGEVLFGAFTGKAALVLRRKGCADARTIHSLIYSVDDSDSWEPTFKLDPNSAVKDAELVIIDECSMVGEELGRDLLSFGTKVLVLGDPAQLPPVKGEGFFTSRRPDFMLTEVHRQAAESPIIRMSMTIREGGRLDYGCYGDSKIITREEVDQQEVVGADQVLVGLNKTRRLYNNRLRQLLNRRDPLPMVGDRLVCLRNNREKKLLNGGLWEVVETKGRNRKKGGVKLLCSSEDHVEAKPTEVFVLDEFFTGDEKDIPWERKKGTDEFTFGYALTCHKAQGSQWDNVYIFDEGFAFREDRARWAYTAITRAAERVTVVQ